MPAGRPCATIPALLRSARFSEMECQDFRFVSAIPKLGAQNVADVLVQQCRRLLSRLSTPLPERARA